MGELRNRERGYKCKQCGAECLDCTLCNGAGDLCKCTGDPNTVAEIRQEIETVRDKETVTYIRISRVLYFLELAAEGKLLRDMDDPDEMEKLHEHLNRTMKEKE